MTAIDTHTTVFTPIRMTLQAEGGVIAALALATYAQLGGGWGLFALLILAPDVFMLGYLVSKQIGAVLYNLAHSYLMPAALGAVAYVMDWQAGLPIALIWVAHIGADRAIGYGLKYASHFKDTHLGRI